MAAHKCKTCGKRFELKRYLTKHELRMHNKEQNSEESRRSAEPLKCSMCDRVFPRLSHLQRHQMTHLNVKNYACNFCEEKFVQKAHLTRHITRKHAEESGEEVQWTACDKCGQVFKTTYEMKAHRRTSHALHRCKKCKEVIEVKNDGLRQHHIRCRDKEKSCHCGASFTRPVDLRAHQTVCLKKVAFICIPCKSFFKQRTEIDRHIKKFHFRSEKCTKCDHQSESPVENSRHAFECAKLIICGYCNLESPDKDHVAEVHWRRLKRAVPKRVAVKLVRDKDVPSTSDEPQKESQEMNPEDIEDEVLSEATSMEHNEYDKDRMKNIETEDSLFDFPDPSTSQLDFNSTVFTEEDEIPEEYLTFSICPKDPDLPFHLRGRLPEELVSLFPGLQETSIVLLSTMSLQRCRMNVRVPVTVPTLCEKETEMRSWMQSPIILEED